MGLALPPAPQPSTRHEGVSCRTAFPEDSSAPPGPGEPRCRAKSNYISDSERRASAHLV